MCKQTWLTLLFTWIVVGALLGGGPWGAAAQAPSPAPVMALLPGSVVNSVWGNSGSDVFAVGYDGQDGGMILHYDGTMWSIMLSGTSAWLTDVWGPGSNSGTGSSAKDVFAVGANGRMLHYDGEVWSPMISGSYGILSDLHGFSRDDVFAVGENGAILHYDGNKWSAMTSGWPDPKLTHEHRESMGDRPYLLCAWGSSGRDVFAVGDFGTILHYDGKTWSPMTSGTTEDLNDVWGTSSDSVYAFGSGTILHYDGKTWSPMNAGTTEALHGPWGTSDHDIFVAAEEGRLLHYNGKVWSVINTGASYGLQQVWGSSDSDLFVGGNDRVGIIVHYDGKVWSTMCSAPAQ